jgi:hypothetical protein
LAIPNVAGYFFGNNYNIKIRCDYIINMMNNNDVYLAIHNNLDKMIQKYSNNEYVFGRLVNYMENLLPTALENATELQKQREERRNQLSANRDEFTTRFLQKNRYFYSSQTEMFLHYDGLHFVIHSEDDIRHQILSTISSENCLREWKHKVNKNILKRIKERSPLNVIPESATIQFVINTLCPSIFPTRNHVKYFLTIIGECIAYKSNTNQPSEAVPSEAVPSEAVPSEALSTHSEAEASMNNTIYILNPALKDIIREIGNQCYMYLGIANIFSNIKFKYYEHNYTNCRLLAIDKSFGRKKIPVPTVLTKYMLDFLCVAAHYVTRFETADNFLTSCSETRLVEHSLFLTRNTPENIVDTFIKSLTVCAPSSKIEMKNIIFLWKKFLDEISLPSIIFYESLKTILKNKLKYDATADCFIGITSIQLPIVSQFTKFWESSIVDCDDSSIEIEEICILFKNWSNKNMNEIFLLELIQHFYPDTVIKNNKSILNIKFI